MRFIKESAVLKYAFLLFFLSAVYGLLMRYNYVFPQAAFPYNNMLQSHSHVAFLGWGYLTTIVMALLFFLNKQQRNKKVYATCLISIASLITLMLISFITGGYGVFSIVLLALFGLCSYVLSYHLLKDIKGKSYGVKFFRFSIYYYLLSSLATWFLAGVILTQGKSDLYYNTVYFYLHFLYNGYFVFALFGLLLKIIATRGIQLPIRLLKPFFIYLNVACIPTYFLSVLWSGVGSTYYVISFAGAIFQLVALFFLWRLLTLAITQLNWSPFNRLLLYFAMIAFSVKIILQLLTALPYFVKISVALKPYFIIGYLHLFTLAYMSVFLILLLIQIGFVNPKKKVQLFGILAFLVGVTGTEIVLFLQGSLLLFKQYLISHYHELMFGLSAIIVLGIALLLFSRLILEKPQNT